MRICPKCGHHDPWYWRGSGLMAGLEFCRFDDFQADYPELAAGLIAAQTEFKTRNFVFDKDYCYHLTKGMNVERQSLIENPTANHTWGIPREAPPHKRRHSFGINPAHHGKTIKIHIYQANPFQRKLHEWNGGRK